jgi:enoyl-CoA hydratase
MTISSSTHDNSVTIFLSREEDAMPTVELVSVHPHVRVLRLNRPEQLNAINFELVADLHRQLDVVASDDECRVVILTGAGRAFCSGLDLKAWGEVPAVGTDPYRKAGSTGQSYLSSLVSHIRSTPQIVIASVNGPAYGGGFALSLACDLRVASVSATFCSAFIRTGLTGTDVGISYFLPRLIGASRAFDLMVTGRSVDADGAMEMGIVSRVAEDAALDEDVRSMAEEVASFTATGLRMTKEAMWTNLDTPSLDACLALENRNQDIAGQTTEVREYMSSYRNRISNRRGR